MMLSLFRLEHLGQDHVFIYLIKIPLPALTKGYLSHQSVHPGFFPFNSKDYLCWLAIEVGWMGAAASTEFFWLVRTLARLPSTLTASQISSLCAIWLGDRTILPLSPHFYRSSRGVWEHNYSAIMVVTTLLRQNFYCWPTKKWPLCANPYLLPIHCKLWDTLQRKIYAPVMAFLSWAGNNFSFWGGLKSEANIIDVVGQKIMEHFDQESRSRRKASTHHTEEL